MDDKNSQNNVNNDTHQGRKNITFPHFIIYWGNGIYH